MPATSKQQQESGAAAAVANGGDGNDPDPVAAASAELAAAREEDSRVEREMHEFYKHWHDEASFLSFWVLEVEGRKITRYKKKPPIFCFVSPPLPLPPPLFRSTPPSLTSLSSPTSAPEQPRPQGPSGLYPFQVAKLVFTNADDAHAARCLELMGLSAEGDFDEVITLSRRCATPRRWGWCGEGGRSSASRRTSLSGWR